MNDKASGGDQSSSEDGIRSISLDPQLTAEGIGGLGDEYPPAPVSRSVWRAPTQAGQDVYDSDNLGYHTIASRG